MNQELLEFVNKSNYISDIPFIFCRNIYEYDIKQANIHALLAMNKISKKEFDYLRILPKHMREVYIGNKIKQDPLLYKDIQEGICKAKYLFVEQNRIQIPQILRIANDSLYVIVPYDNMNGNIIINNIPFTFVRKNHFTNYMKLGKVLFFCNSFNDLWNIDIKGIGDDKISLHQELLSTICNIIDARNNGGKEISISEFNRYYNQYNSFTSPVEIYRELNSDSKFRVRVSQNEEYLLDSLGFIYNKKDIDISYNRNIFRDIYSYLLQS